MYRIPRLPPQGGLADSIAKAVATKQIPLASLVKVVLDDHILLNYLFAEQRHLCNSKSHLLHIDKCAWRGRNSGTHDQETFHWLQQTPGFLTYFAGYLQVWDPSLEPTYKPDLSYYF